MDAYGGVGRVVLDLFPFPFSYLSVLSLRSRLKGRLFWACFPSSAGAPYSGEGYEVGGGWEKLEGGGEGEGYRCVGGVYCSPSPVLAAGLGLEGCLGEGSTASACPLLFLLALAASQSIALYPAFLRCFALACLACCSGLFGVVAAVIP